MVDLDVSRRHGLRVAARLSPPMRSAAMGLAALMPVAAGLAALLRPGAGALPSVLAAMLLAAGGAAMLVGLRRTYPHPRFGPGNWVSLVRLCMVAALAGALAAPAMSAGAWAFTGLALVTLALDGVDGWAARRAGMESAFGARFDMEVDTGFALVLALAVWVDGTLGPWVVALGLMRPAFVALAAVWPALRGPLPPALWRKAVCVIQIGALILLSSPALAPQAAAWLAAAVLLLLVLSFARDILWLARREG